MIITIYDYYEGDNVLVYRGASAKDARAAIKAWVEDTSGECYLNIMVKGNARAVVKVVEENLVLYSERIYEKVVSEL